MRTFTTKHIVDPDTFAPMALLYLEDTYTGVKYSQELRFDLKCMDDKSHAMVIESFFEAAIDAVHEAIPDITEQELHQMIVLCRAALL